MNVFSAQRDALGNGVFGPILFEGAASISVNARRGIFSAQRDAFGNGVFGTIFFDGIAFEPLPDTHDGAGGDGDGARFDEDTLNGIKKRHHERYRKAKLAADKVKAERQTEREAVRKALTEGLSPLQLSQAALALPMGSERDALLLLEVEEELAFIRILADL